MATELIYENFDRIMVSAVLRESPEASVVAAAGINFIEAQNGMKAKINVISLVKVTEPWSEVLTRAERVANSPQFAFHAEGGDVDLIVDNSRGTSQTKEQIYEMETDSRCIELTLSEPGSDKWRYIDVVGALVSCFQGGRIEVAEGIELAEALEASLGTVSVGTADTTDALPLAVALICFEADQAIPV